MTERMEPETCEWRVTGMDCASCAGKIRDALGKLPGVHSAAVNLATERVHVQADEGLELDALSAAVARAGYQVPPQTWSLHIEGMTCARCVGRPGPAPAGPRRLRRALRAPG